MNNIEMIFGAPGCGKTTRLMDLLQELLTEYEPIDIAFVSFTKKGSYEGRDRAIQRFGFKESDFPYFRTIHSIAFRELGVSKYDIISRRNYKEFSKAMGMNFLGYYTEDLVNNDDKYLFQVSLEKNNPVRAQVYLDELDIGTYSFVKNNYARYKHEMKILDFDDLIIQFLKLNKTLPVKVAIIDEAQDLTSLQWSFCNLAFKDCEKVFIAGDDDQAIYEWSGADVQYFLKLANSSKIQILDRSYRLKENILEFSKKISVRITERVDKVFSASAEGGEIFYHNSLEELVFNNEESYYVLSRNNFFLARCKKELMKKALIFSAKGSSSVNLRVVEAIKKYEHLRKSMPAAISKDVFLKSLLKKDVREFGPWYDVFELPIEESLYYRDLFKNKADMKDGRITLSTIHGVKGGEADNVVLLLDVTKNVYKQLYSNLSSELRCLYVGVTRAKKNLHLVFSNSNFGYEEVL